MFYSYSNKIMKNLIISEKDKRTNLPPRFHLKKYLLLLFSVLRIMAFLRMCVFILLNMFYSQITAEVRWKDFEIQKNNTFSCTNLSTAISPSYSSHLHRMYDHHTYGRYWWDCQWKYAHSQSLLSSTHSTMHPVQLYFTYFNNNTKGWR